MRDMPSNKPQCTRVQMVYTMTSRCQFLGGVHNDPLHAAFAPASRHLLLLQLLLAHLEQETISKLNSLHFNKVLQILRSPCKLWGLAFISRLNATGASFKPESGNIILDLVDVIFGDALTLGLALLLRHVASHQVTHHRLRSKK